MPSDPNILSLVNGEKYFVMCVKHIIGEKKYECDMLNFFVMASMRFCGRVYHDVLSEFFFGILELYLWYSQTTSVSNGCGGGIRPYVI